MLNGLMTRSGLEPNSFRMDLCCEVRLDLVTYGGRLGRGCWVYSRNSVRLVEFSGYPTGGLAACMVFSSYRLVSEMELFFPNLGEAVSRL